MRALASIARGYITQSVLDLATVSLSKTSAKAHAQTASGASGCSAARCLSVFVLLRWHPVGPVSQKGVRVGACPVVVFLHCVGELSQPVFLFCQQCSCTPIQIVRTPSNVVTLAFGLKSLAKESFTVSNRNIHSTW